MTTETKITLSAREAAAAYAKARTKKDRDAIAAYVAARAATSKRVRWTKLADDIAKGDATRITARATGDWAAVNAARAEKPATEPKAPKAPAKAKAKAPAKAPAPVAANAPAKTDINALVSALASLDEVEMAAFFTALTKARA